MAVVKSIGPGSAFKVGLVVYGIFGLIGGVLCSGFASPDSPYTGCPLGVPGPGFCL